MLQLYTSLQDNTFPLFDHLRFAKVKGEMVVKGRPGNKANFRLHGSTQSMPECKATARSVAHEVSAAHRPF